MTCELLRGREGREKASASDEFKHLFFFFFRGTDNTIEMDG